MLVGTRDGLYRSSDAAQTWYEIDSSGQVWDIEFNPQNPNNVYLGTSTGLKFSSDFGETIKQVTPDQLDGPVMSVAVNCNGTALYISDLEHGVLVTLSDSAVSVPIDETRGVEYGQFTSADPESTRFTSREDNSNGNK